MGGSHKIAAFLASLLLVSIISMVKPPVAQAAPEEPNVQWSETYGGPGGDWAYSVIQTPDGGFAIAGYTGSYGAGGGDFWLVKTDRSGGMEWSETYGGSGWDTARSVVQTSDGGFALAGVTGSYGAGADDFWLVKTDSEGRMEWSETYGGSGWDWAWSVIQTSDGGFAIAGETYSYGAGDEDFWLVKTDGSGRVQWSETYGGSGWDTARSVIQTSDGGFALAGVTGAYSTGEEDFWLVKLPGKGPGEIPGEIPGEGHPRALMGVAALVIVIIAGVLFYLRRRGRP